MDREYRIIVPWVNAERNHLWQETDDAVHEFYPEAEFHETLGLTGYAELLCRLWRDGITFVIIEMDIVPRSDTVKLLLDCPISPWCGFRYKLSTGYRACLGMTKFESSIIHTYPFLMEEAAAICDDGLTAGHFSRMDVRIERVLWQRNLKRHAHEPPVVHLNPIQNRYGGEVRLDPD